MSESLASVQLPCYLTTIHCMPQKLIVGYSFRFLTAYPPFHASTPDKVFDNILSRRIDWHEDEVEMSPEARDFIDRLLAFDPSQRLGANGADEVKRHPFLAGIDWVNLRTEEANFVPQVQDPESTDYFDSRGATHQVFEDDANDEDEARLAKARNANTQNKDLPDHQQEQQQQQARPHGGAGPRTSSDPADLEEARRSMRERQETSASDDFGSFVFKNLDVLKQANDDVIRKLRSDQLIPSAMPPSDLPPRSRYDQLGRKTRPKRDSIGIDPRVSGSTSAGLDRAASAEKLTACYALMPLLSASRMALRRPPLPRPLRLAAGQLPLYAHPLDSWQAPRTRAGHQSCWEAVAARVPSPRTSPGPTLRS